MGVGNKYYRNIENGWGIVFTAKWVVAAHKGWWGYGGV
jgi:hypothetical protein